MTPSIGDAVHPPASPIRRPNPLRAPTIAAPPMVLEAIEAHERVTLEFEEAYEAARQAQLEAAQALKDDVVDSAELVAAGKKPLPPEKRTEPQAQARVREAEHRLAVAAEAGRKTWQALTDAVVAVREPWQADLAVQEREAAATFATALAQLREAADTVKLTRGAQAWLADQDMDRGQLPNHVATGRLHALLGNREHPVTDLLTALDHVANPPAPTSARTHKTVAA